MKFLCNDCQALMEFVENKPAPDGGSMKIIYNCPRCSRGISMVTNAGETQMVQSLGVTIGHEALDTTAPEPMAMIRGALSGQTPTQPAQTGPDPVWTDKAMQRLSAAPSFVQGMVYRLYTDYARQKGYAEITPAVMNEAREALGMMGM
jgi:hypothetical protein